MNKFDESELARVLDLDDKALLAELGASLAGPLAAPMPKHEAIRRAKAWLKDKRADLVSTVCTSRRIQELCNTEDSLSNRSTLVLAVADLVMTVIGNLPVLTVAALLVREGLNSICAEYWSKG